MPPQTPLILWDNVFDTVTLYPGAVLTASSEVAGREAFRVADYRRERTWWQPTTDGVPNGNNVAVDLGVGQSRGVDFIVLDRGHNLWGRSVAVHGSPGAGAWDIIEAMTVPAQGTLGGSPVWPSFAVTEEGVCYSLRATPLAARREWRFFINSVASFIPVVTGITLGLRTQLLGFSRVYDEDQGERTEVSERSKAGYRATDTTYSWRVVELDLALVGAAEYDATIRELRRVLFARNQPAFVFMDYETYPARGWLYQYEGASWGFPKSRVYRGGRLRMVEVGQSLSGA
jgi:hypothetical protein